MAFQIEQSASAMELAVCSGILLPVVTKLVPEAAVYAMPIGPAQAVSASTVDNASTSFIRV